MNLGVIETSKCVNNPPGPDTRCDDEAFSLAHPELCPDVPRFFLKPSMVLVCELGQVNFKAFSVVNGVELDVTESTVFTTSNSGVLAIGASGGAATGLVEGNATVTGRFGALLASANIDVLAGNPCCDGVTLAMMVVVDQSRSMSQCFTGSGSGCSTKLVYARNAALAFINGVNNSKDLVGLVRFTQDEAVVLAAPTVDNASVASLVTSTTISQTQADTEFYDAIALAIASLNATSADRKILVLISDGEDTTPSYAVKNPILLSQNFQSTGGIVMALGVRAHDAGYNLLSKLATGGFFLNGYEATAASSLAYLIGLRSYICGGNCSQPGDGWENRGALGYAMLTNWDLANGTLVTNNALDPVNPAYMTGSIDLLGNGFFDLLPGNGLYVDLVSDANPSGPDNALLVSKAKFTLVTGSTYRFSVKLAGNQVINAASHVQCRLVAVATGVEILNNVVLITDYKQDFQTQGWTFVSPISGDVKITIQQTTASANLSETPTGQKAGGLLGEVRLENMTAGILLFSDNFNGENPVYVGPKCGQGTTLIETGVNTVFVDQIPDPTVDPIVVAVNDGSGHMHLEEAFGGSSYTYTLVTVEGETYISDGLTVLYSNSFNAVRITTPTSFDPRVIAKRIYRPLADGTWHLLVELAPGTADYIDTESEAEWYARGPTTRLRPTSNTTGLNVSEITYGYVYGYNCYEYGEGCLTEPPPAQLQDPNPLPDLENGKSGGSFTATANACATCPTGFINVGPALDATQISGGADYETRIQLTAAAKIKVWEVTFARDWTADVSAVPLQLEGSLDGTTWVPLAVSTPETTNGLADLSLAYMLDAETSVAYAFFRAVLGPGSGGGVGKVVTLQVFAAVANSICKDATASGGTAAAALANAYSAALQAANDSLKCRPIYSATETFVGETNTASATGSSLNSQSEAQAIALAKAKAIAEPET